MLFKLQKFIQYINNVLLIPIFCSIILSLIGLSGEMPVIFNFMACGLFFLEWLIGLYLAEDKKEFFLNPYNLADLISSIPASSTFLGARIVRAIRIVKLLSLTVRAKRIKNKIYSAFNAIMIIVASMMASTIILTEVEPQSFETDSNYWEVFQVLVTGEFSNEPETPAGRFAGSIVMILGVVLFGYSAGFISSILDDEDDNKLLEEIKLAREETKKLNKKIDDFLAGKSDS